MSGSGYADLAARGSERAARELLAVGDMLVGRLVAAAAAMTLLAAVLRSRQVAGTVPIQR